MSVREKTKTLYSRNGIRIIKIENLQECNRNIAFNEIVRHERLENFEMQKTHGAWVNIRKESPLGFYYISKKYVNNDDYNKMPKTVTYKKFVISLNTEKYELEYPIEYSANNDVQKINVEMRPWDIVPGYKGMPDNMINALVKEVNKFIDLIFEYKKSLNLKFTPEEYKKIIMVNLFGYEDGPKITSNNIKILSHGFDLKKSFRKRKEL